MDRVEQNILESYNSDGSFDWEIYQYLCDIGDYWGCDRVEVEDDTVLISWEFNE